MQWVNNKDANKEYQDQFMVRLMISQTSSIKYGFIFLQRIVFFCSFLLVLLH